jgi:hypothetical protein
VSPGSPAAAELAVASVRVTRGTPTAEEVAALAVLLTARLHAAQETEDEAAADALAPTVWHHQGSGFRPPGAWAS